ncbi:hypothetical protein C1T17_16295 [Sphingobium sp. SCG-1]|uniref:hypothetical protein n=1 Tax=Sphingobium sp. SCG-1 TaxID=2072936 RepID=UPI000CD680E0|nr:hypothetical protein [Sphingobium sp. SCG-1]AUW59414.1 hypothetical protein C1T17_16295 [Sphingobium sp. SCG-1]
MIVVRVELLSAIDGKTTELARMHICNVGGTVQRGDYDCQTLRGRSTADLDRATPQRKGEVRGHPRLAQHVWNLVAKALASMAYGDGK